MREAGKGDKRRPEDIKAFDEGYARIFRKNSSEEAVVEVTKLTKELYEQDVVKIQLDKD